MKAAVYRKTNSGKILQLMDLPIPSPKENEVLIKVHAASVNPLDWRLKSPRPGVDIAGQVETVGSNVTSLKPGDAVFGTGKGGFAKYACASESNLVIKPDYVSFEEAASLPIAGLTALQGLRDIGRLQPGQSVLINGAAGGVGTFSVQIAKSFGAHVTGICSTRNVDMVQSLGADRVIDYTSSDFTMEERRYDLLLDNVGNRPLSALKRVLAKNGRCTMVGAPKEIKAVLRHLLEAFARSLFLREKFAFFIAKVKKDDLLFLCELMKAGKLRPAIDKVYPLTQTADAIAYVEQGHARAKILISMEAR